MQTDYQCAIIGAGFAGIIAALRLKKSGRNSFVIFEGANELGGTWRDNHYPGCACDVPSIVYSIDNEPNPNWTEFFPHHAEILAYMKMVVQRNDLEKQIQFETYICEAQFIVEKGYWQLTDKKGKITTARMVFFGAGPLNRAQIPLIKGVEKFKGKSFHSSEWEHEYDLKGKKVAIIGTGASAIQIVPSIAEKVSELLVFQRTAAWIANRGNRKISNIEKSIFNHFPIVQRIAREVIYGIMEVRGKLFTGNKWIHAHIKRNCLRKLKKEVQNPETRQKLTPHYELGCKRILNSDDYLPTFNRPNVHLITENIVEITENEIITNDGKKHEINCIVWATGFDAAQIRTKNKILGLNQRELFSEWLEKGMEAHKGTTIAGFPNLFFILGPNTGLGHSSMLHIMESQMNYAMQFIEKLENEAENAFLDVSAEAQTAYNVEVQRLFKDTVWVSGCKSWYIDEKGRNTVLYPRLATHFRKNTQRFDGENYVLGNK